MRGGEPRHRNSTGSNSTSRWREYEAIYGATDPYPRHPLTRYLIGRGVSDLENAGLHYLEDGACSFAGPAAAFCTWAFNSPIGEFVNNEIESIPLVRHIAGWFQNVCDEFVPRGVQNCMDDIADAWSGGGGGWISDAEDAGESIASGLFGWL